jgi:bifunctional non-homologous end joining protein LigD
VVAREIKFDGYRMLAHIAGGGARMLSRNGLSWSAKLPEIAGTLPGLPVSEAILDGEVCHGLANCVTSFGALQTNISDRTTSRLVYFLFDIIYLDG